MMRATVIYKDSTIEKGHHNFFNDFIRFLFDEYPLKKDVTITFTNERLPKMSTGSHIPEDKIYILVDGRINRDILRTLSHEWIHEYQHSVLGRKKGKDIGGKNEDEANAIAGQLIKMFEKKFPDKENKMYK